RTSRLAAANIAGEISDGLVIPGLSTRPRTSRIVTSANSDGAAIPHPAPSADARRPGISARRRRSDPSVRVVSAGAGPRRALSHLGRETGRRRHAWHVLELRA